VTFERGERRASALLKNVELPDPFDVAEFCLRVAAHLGRPLRLVPQDMGSMGEAVGLLVGLPDHDEIHYVADTSVYHQQAIVLHEVGHLLADHAGMHPFPLSLLAGDWDPAVVERLRGRHRYDDDEEREAEGFATAILDLVDRHTRRAGGQRGGARLAAMFVQ
jgi:hypothetical protein